MITISTLFTFLGFEFFYQTSRNAQLHRYETIEKWFLKNEKLARAVGTTFMLAALTLSIIYFGVGSGGFTFLCMLMMIGSLVVLISPIWKLNVSWLFAGFGMLFLIEIL